MRTDSIIDMENQEKDMMTFNHIDAGEDFVDHHVLLGIQARMQSLITYLSMPPISMIFKRYYWLKSKG